MIEPLMFYSCTQYALAVALHLVFISHKLEWVEITRRHPYFYDQPLMFKVTFTHTITKVKVAESLEKEFFSRCAVLE